MEKALSTVKNSKEYIEDLIQGADLKYKVVGAALAAGVGIVTISKLIFGPNQPDHEDVQERYIARRIVKNWWIPMIETKLTNWITPFKTTAEMEEDKAKENMTTNRWRYPDTNHMTSLDPMDLNPIEEQMPEDLLYLHRTTRLLGEIEKEHVLKLWKDVEIIEVPQGQKLFKIGDEDESIYIVIAGQVDVYCIDEALNLSGFRVENASHMTLDNVHPGGTIFSVLSFIDIQPIKTIEAETSVHSTFFRIPMRSFQRYWYSHPHLLNRALRRLLRRIYQVVFVALHKVLGLSTELIKREIRPQLSEEILAMKSFTEEERRAALEGAMDYLNLEGQENFNILRMAAVRILNENEIAVKAGNRTSVFVYVYKGELEVLQRVTYEVTQLVKTETDEVLFHVKSGQAIGGLSYLTDDVNIFTIKAPQKAVVVVIPEKVLNAILAANPFVIQILANSVISRLSPFAREMDFSLEWTLIESGHPVYRAGELSVYTYLVLSGRLRCILTDSKGRNSIKGEYGRNDWIGLVETLTKKFRSKTVIAVRDTELAKLPDGLLTLIKLKFPVVSMRLLDFLGKRVAKTYTTGFNKQKTVRGSATISLIGLSIRPNQRQEYQATVPTRVFAYCLFKAFEIYGNVGTSMKIMTQEYIVETLGEDSLSEDNDYHLTAYLASQEDHYGLIIFVAEPDPTCSWTTKCIKQADTILILANGKLDHETGPRGELTAIEKRVNLLAPRAKKEFILVHSISMEDEDDRVHPILTRFWLNKREWISFHHHIGIRENAYNYINESIKFVEENFQLINELDKHSDFARLSRWLSKNSVGVVLGGGGAKGAAHIGVIRVLTELDIPIDYIAGVSIGSFVGGLYAMTQDIEKVENIACAWFDKISKPFRYILDMTFPHLSLFKGEAFNNSIHAIFGDTQIEDLRIPYFTVSTDMTANRSRIHKSGPLFRYARASMSLSGYFPPICDLDGHFLFDGGYTNLVPANLMRLFGAGYILGVDVSAADPIETTNYGDHLSGFRVLLTHLLPYIKQFKIPNYFSLQQQLSFVQSALYMEIIKEMDRCSVYIRPPLDFFGTGDFYAFRHILETGYTYTQQIFRHCRSTDEIEIIWTKIAKDLQTFAEDIVKANTNKNVPVPTKSEKELEETTVNQQHISNERRRRR